MHISTIYDIVVGYDARQFLMEIVSPITFTMSLLGSMLDTAPMSLAAALDLGKSATTKLFNLTTPTKILASLFLIHCEISFLDKLRDVG